MRVESILIINRAPFEYIDLQLGNNSVYVLSGINGRGKTTIISFVVDSFYELAKKAFHNEFNDKSSKYYRISSGLYSLDNSKPSIVYIRYKDNNENNLDYIDICGVCTQEEYDCLINVSNKIEFSNLEKGLVKRGNIKYWTETDTKKIENIFSTTILTYFPAYRYEMPSYLNDPYKFHLSFTKDMGFIGYLNNPIEITSDLSNIANWIMDVVLDMMNYQTQETINLYSEMNDVLTYILISKVGYKTRFGIGKRTSGAARIAVMNKEKKDIQIYPSIFNMSSGELALLCVFMELVKQSDKINMPISSVNGIVLVDEIEKHLHIKLQKEALPKLMRLFPNIQFIVSSHSPFYALGLQDETDIQYTLVDLDKNGEQVTPNQTEIYREVYDMMISQNLNYELKYNELRKNIEHGTKPIIITEGKSDWKHIKAAQKKLGINDVEIEFCEYEDTMGDNDLYTFLQNCARMQQMRPIIGIFDRDAEEFYKDKELIDCEYKRIGNNVYAFAIPLLHEDLYGSYISIEHYYKKDDLLKKDNKGRRLFLGDEFFVSGNSKDGNYQTKAKIQKKIAVNGVIDEKVFERTDLEQKHSIAMSKDDFAQKVYDDDPFAKDFDMSSFAKIFDVIKDILNDINNTET